MTRKRMATEHEGWLGEPFASDFASAWGLILLEDIYDASWERKLSAASLAAKAKGLRYIAYPLPRKINLGREVITNNGGVKQLYVRKGTKTLEIYYYLHWREKENDRAVLNYRSNPEVTAKNAVYGRAWDRANKERRRETNKDWKDENRDKFNAYSRSYMPGYYARNPDKLATKRKADVERRRQQRAHARRVVDAVSGRSLLQAPAQATTETHLGQGMKGVTGTDHPRARYGDDVRGEAIRLWREEQHTQQEIASHLGCHVQSVRRWLQNEMTERNDR